MYYYSKGGFSLAAMTQEAVLKNAKLINYCKAKSCILDHSERAEDHVLEKEHYVFQSYITSDGIA